MALPFFIKGVVIEKVTCCTNYKALCHKVVILGEKNRLTVTA